MVPLTLNQGFKGRPCLSIARPSLGQKFQRSPVLVPKILWTDRPCPVLNPKTVLVIGRPFPILGSRQGTMDSEIDSQFNHHLSLGLKLSSGNFDVVFFPDKLNFFDASQEKFEFWNYHYISKLLIQKSYFFQFSNFKSAVPIYVVNCPCLVIGKMLMLWVKLCCNIMKQKYGQQSSTEHPDFKMAIKSFGTTTPRNIWVNDNFRHFFQSQKSLHFNSPVITIFFSHSFHSLLLT